MQATSFTCSHCLERIEDSDCPVVVYVVAGVAPMHPAVQKGLTDVTGYPLPAIVREILSQPVNRMDFCAKCFGEKLGVPLVLAPAPVVEETGV